MSVLGKRGRNIIDDDDVDDESKDDESYLSAPNRKKQRLSNKNDNENEAKNEENIILNVGGIKYKARKQILARYKSILSAIKPSSDGVCVIDRNGKLFEYILQYFQTQKLTLPSTWNKTEIWKFYVEVKYFMVESLFDMLLDKLFDSKTKHKHKHKSVIVRDYISNKDIESLILYNPFGSTLMFYSKSKDVSPGTGTREILAPNHNYKELSKIKNWRQILSNFYQIPNKQKLFDLDNLSWISVEHYFQAAKFKQINFKYYKSFSLNSGSNLSKGSGTEAKKAGGKKAFKLDSNTLRNWSLIKHEIMQKALLAKYTQNKDIGRILIMTKNAKLLHSPGRVQPIIEYDLMIVRNHLFSINNLFVN